MGEPPMRQPAFCTYVAICRLRRPVARASCLDKEPLLPFKA